MLPGQLLGNLAVYAGLLPECWKTIWPGHLSSAAAGRRMPIRCFPAYAASKAAMVSTVENMQEDLDGKGDFAVVCLAPGANQTDTLERIRAAGAEIKTTVDIS